ncbi:MAG: MauE/DoxX family redox-associated membrane protein [Limisphaerales bacterium]
MAAWFLWSVGIILAIIGVSKAFSATGPARSLDTADPLIRLTFRQLLLVIGLVELLIAFFCLFTDRRRFSLLAVAWLSTNFLVYRLGLWFIGWHRPCGCMGNLTDLLHISPRTADNIMKGVLAFLLVGSYGILFSQWRQRRAQERAVAPEQGKEAARVT